MHWLLLSKPNCILWSYALRRPRQFEILTISCLHKVTQRKDTKHQYPPAAQLHRQWCPKSNGFCSGVYNQFIHLVYMLVWESLHLDCLFIKNFLHEVWQISEQKRKFSVSVHHLSVNARKVYIIYESLSFWLTSFTKKLGFLVYMIYQKLAIRFTFVLREVNQRKPT